jgi:hypothetical protein
MSPAEWHRTLRIAVPILTVATVGVLARADAPPGQYAAFNQADTVITDNKTLLNWQRTVTTLSTFSGAVAACNGLSLGGFPSGWRLPSYKELLTLVDESPHMEYPTGAPVQIAIDGNAFPETPVTPFPGYYWTSSVDPNAAASLLVVQFADGQGVSLAGNQTAWVRCVH